MADNQSDTIVVPQIQQAELAGNYFSKHINFVIIVPGGKEVRRRFNDFFWLRDWVADQLPGVYVPSIPPKLPIAMWPQGYLAERKRELQWFLKNCSQIPYIRNNDAFQTFLDCDYNTNFKDAIKKHDAAHTKNARPVQLKNLKEAFNGLENEPLPNEHEERGKEYLEHIQHKIEVYTRMLANSEGLRDSLTKSDETMQTVLQHRSELDEMQHEDISQNNYMSRFLTESKPEHTQYFKADCANNKMWSKCIQQVWIPVLKKNMNDLKCIEEAMIFRDKIKVEMDKATEVAAKWKSSEALDNLRANQVDQKHRELDHEETLQHLYDLVVKVTFNHLKMVQKLNMDRWTQHYMIMKKHLVESLGKTKQSWFEARNVFAPTNTNEQPAQSKEEKEVISDPAPPAKTDADDGDSVENQEEDAEEEEEELDTKEVPPETADNVDLDGLQDVGL